ncbi:MAG: hypothetical protein GY865_05635 [candidate division Zixibacteria bacterium]|nr:hypothetical protein [candidate division Zixibacteria bacterium]
MRRLVFYSLIFVVIGLLVGGCVSKTKQIRQERVNDYIVSSIDWLGHSECLPKKEKLCSVYFGIEKHSHRLTGELKYFVTLTYGSLAPSEYLINEGDSLTIIVDGNSNILNCAQFGKTISIETRQSPLVFEFSKFRADKALVSDFAVAKSVEITIHGRHKTLTGQFLEEDFVNIKKFYKKYIK